MPEMNGTEIIRMINHSDMKVIAMTAHDISIKEELMEAGFDGCLFKPFRPEALENLLASAAQAPEKENAAAEASVKEASVKEVPANENRDDRDGNLPGCIAQVSACRRKGRGSPGGDEPGSQTGCCKNSPQAATHSQDVASGMSTATIGSLTRTYRRTGGQKNPSIHPGCLRRLGKYARRTERKSFRVTTSYSSTVSMWNFISPAGTFTITSSPAFLPKRAWAIGDLMEIFPS